MAGLLSSWLIALTAAVYGQGLDHELLLLQQSRPGDRHKGLTLSSPEPTTLADIADAEISSPEMVPVNYSHFDVIIMAYNRPDYISDTLKRSNQWDLEDVNRICHAFVKHGGKGNILDVGGNIGGYTLPLAACLKQRGHGHNQVISIEGYPENARHLRAGIRYNRLANIHLYEYAVSSPTAQGTLRMDKDAHALNNMGMTRVVPSAFISLPTPVRVTTIDEIAKRDRPAMSNVFLMKMDIEGYEKFALEGAEEFFKNGPCVVFIEMKYNEKLVEFFQGRGYKLRTKTGIDANGWFERADLQECIAKLT